MRRLAGFVSLLAMTGCSLAPPYGRPLPPVPSSFPSGDAYVVRSGEALPTVTYQDIFLDPQLQVIIAQALANNQDISIAVANMASARAQYRVQRAALLPEIDANADVATVDRGNSASTNNESSGRSTSYSVDAGLSAFEIDLFGRQRSLSQAAMQEYLATEAAVHAARLTLVAEVASAYLTLATDRSLLSIANDTEISAAKSVDLTRARLNGGIAPRTDLRQAETVLAQARSDQADLISLVAQDRNALELLVGAPVADALLPKSIEAVGGLLRELPAGLDSRILLRRPDVVQAEYKLRAANAEIGAARANFFPTISLTALTGFASSALSSLFSNGAFTWSVQPSAALPIFDGGASEGNLEYAKAQRDLTLAQYKLAIQTAFREVADALARRGTIDRQFAAQSQLEASARDSDVLAEARYREGIDPFLNRLETQRTLYAARRTLASTLLLKADNLVTLYRTLGGDQLVDALPPPKSHGMPLKR
jgi:multidrug efflux system outer membrane protein